MYIMGYKHKVSGSLDKRLVYLPKKVKNMIVVLRSPWGSMPTESFTQ